MQKKLLKLDVMEVSWWWWCWGEYGCKGHEEANTWNEEKMQVMDEERRGDRKRDGGAREAGGSRRRWKRTEMGWERKKNVWIKNYKHEVGKKSICQRKGKIKLKEMKMEYLPPLSLTLKLRAAPDSGGMLKYTVLSFPPSSLSIARSTCTTWSNVEQSRKERLWRAEGENTDTGRASATTVTNPQLKSAGIQTSQLVNFVWSHKQTSASDVGCLLWIQ